MISRYPAFPRRKPGSAMTPLPGISAEVVDDDGSRLESSPDMASSNRLSRAEPAVAVDAARHLP